MTLHLLDTERIKLTSTRAPWLCVFITATVTVGYAVALASVNPTLPDLPPVVAATQIGYMLGLVTAMVMATLAVTSEYANGTIKTTFLAEPRRGRVLLAKIVVVCVAAGILGEATAWAAYWAARSINPVLIGPIETGPQLRLVAGVGLIYLIGAAIAVAVGLLVRHTAGAVALVLLVPLLIENLLGAIPGIGADIHRWLPFNVAAGFLTGGLDDAEATGPPWLTSDTTLSPWWALAYVATIAALLLTAAIVTANRRDA